MFGLLAPPQAEKFLASLRPDLWQESNVFLRSAVALMLLGAGVVSLPTPSSATQPSGCLRTAPEVAVPADLSSPADFSAYARQTYGLPPRAATEAAATATAGISGRGFDASAAEERTLDDRAAAAERVKTVLGGADGPAAGPSYSGMYTDHRLGRIVVSTTDEGEAVGRLLATTDTGGIVHVRKVKWSWQELLDAANTLRTQAAQLGEAGVKIVSFGPRQAENCLVVTVSDDAETARVAIGKLIPADIFRVERGQMPAMAWKGGTNAPPLRGALTLGRGKGEGGCNSGWIGYRNTVPTTYFQLFAAHCTTVAGNVWQKDIFIGHTDRRNAPAAGWSTPGIADAARVPVDSSMRSSAVWMNPNQGKSFTSTQGNSGDAPGDEVCHAGEVVYEHNLAYVCAILQETSLDYCLVDGSCYPYGRRASTVVYRGDSGGAVFNNSSATALGVVSAVNAAQTDSHGHVYGQLIYAHIYDVLRSMDVHGLYR